MPTNKNRQITSRFIAFARKYGGAPLIAEAARRYKQIIATQGQHKRAKTLTKEWGDRASTILQALFDEEQRVEHWVQEIEQSGATDKLVCVIFNDLLEEANWIVTKGTREQIRHLIATRGLFKAENLLAKIITDSAIDK